MPFDPTTAQPLGGSFDPSSAQPLKTASAFPKGMVEPGTQNPLDYSKYPKVKNPDGSFSNVVTFSTNIDGKEVLLPSMIGGKRVTAQQAIENYKKTGDHFGKFDTPEDADAFANALETRMQKEAPPQPPLRTGNPMATQEHAPAPTLAQEAQGYAEGIGQGAFNVGGIAGSRVNPNYEAERAARAEQTPISSTLGYITGAVASGGPLVKGIGAVGGLAARALGRTAAAALPETAGLLRRGATVAGIGGVGGAASAAGEGQDVPTGAAVGAAVAPAAVGLGKVATSLGRAVKGVVSGSQRSTNAVRTLAQNYKMTTDEMTTALDNFQAQQGRPASLSDIADLHSKGALKQLAAKNPAFGAEVAKAAEARATVEPKAVTGNPNQPSDVPSFEKYRKDRMDAAMKPFENNPVQLSKPVLDALVEPDVYETLPRTQKRLILNAKDGTKPLTVRELDNLRQTFASKAGEGDSARYGEYAKSIEALTTNAEPQYGAAMNQWRRDSNFIDSFAHGRNGGSQTKGGNDMLQAALATNEGKVGYKLGAAERTAASNVEDVAPGFIKPADRIGSAEAAHLAIAGAKAGSPWAAYHLIRAIPSIRASDNTLRLAAKYLLDPNMARQGVALLKQSKASDAEIAKVVAAIAGGAGASTANAMLQ